jgi:molybdate transport system permease protein
VKLPLVVRVVAVVAAVSVVAPFAALLVSVPWSDLWANLTSDSARSALRLSLASATVAAMIALVLGLPLATVLARSTSPVAHTVRALMTVPVVLPPVVGGVALLALLGRSGVIGGPLYDCCGVTITYTFWAVVISQVFVSMPFLVMAIDGALRQQGGGLGPAASALGARPWAAWWKVTVPSITPAILSGVALAWARALGEFGATITFAGSLPGVTRTLPLAIYAQLSEDRGEAITLAVLLVVVSVTVLIALRHRWVIGLTRPGQLRRESRDRTAQPGRNSSNLD